MAELRHPVTKTLRVKQLLHEGGPGDLPPFTSSGSDISAGGLLASTSTVAGAGATSAVVSGTGFGSGLLGSGPEALAAAAATAAGGAAATAPAYAAADAAMLGQAAADAGPSGTEALGPRFAPSPSSEVAAKRAGSGGSNGDGAAAIANAAAAAVLADATLDAPTASPATVDSAAALESAPDGAADGAAAVTAAATQNAPSPGLLRVVKGKYDIVVTLDFSSLMQVYGGELPYEQNTLGPAARLRALPSAASLLASQLSQPDPFGGGSSGGLVGASANSDLLGDARSEATAGADASGGSGGAGSHPAGGEGITELALRAFPGCTPAAQLRRAIVVHLAGLPRRSQQWTHLGTFVATAQSALWLNPANRCDCARRHTVCRCMVLPETPGCPTARTVDM